MTRVKAITFHRRRSASFVGKRESEREPKLRVSPQTEAVGEYATPAHPVNCLALSQFLSVALNWLVQFLRTIVVAFRPNKAAAAKFIGLPMRWSLSHE